MSSQHILVTGAAGTIGKVVVRHLQDRGHRIRGFDRIPMPDVTEQVVANLTDQQAMSDAVRGVDALIHLAATPDEADFATDLVPNNIVGPWQILTAARDAKVKRVILAGTIRAGRLHQWETKTVRIADGFAPHDGYSFTKAACEVMGEMFARLYGMTVLLARIGWVVRNEEEVQKFMHNPWGGNIALSQRDVATFFSACVENELRFPTNTRYTATFVTSRPTQRPTVDLSEARDIIGWEPADVWPEGTPWEALYQELKRTRSNSNELI